MRAGTVRQHIELVGRMHAKCCFGMVYVLQTVLNSNASCSSMNDEPFILYYFQGIKLIEQVRITKASHNRFHPYSIDRSTLVTIHIDGDVHPIYI